jgi:hypothetical protein
VKRNADGEFVLDCSSIERPDFSGVRVRYFKRTLALRETDDAGTIIYAVREVPRAERTDPVQVIAGFPVGWRPTMNPGEALCDRSSTQQIFRCQVPRSGFARGHYTEVAELEALGLYPDLAAAARDHRPPANQ